MKLFHSPLASLTVALALCLCLCTPSYAQDCSLEPLATQSMTVPVEIDRVRRNISVRRFTQYIPSKTEGHNISRAQRVLVSFDDFAAIYKRFVQLRYHPKDQCDTLNTGSYAADISPEGFAVGQFNAQYEDNICFNLRFFESNPGVRKEGFTKKLFGGTLTVFNAFQPAMPDGTFQTRIATSYKGNGGGKLDKVANAPLTGFLGSSQFTALISDAVSPILKTRPENYTPDDIRFFKDTNGTHLDIVYTDNLTNEAACADRNEKLKTGYWKGL